MHKYVFFCFHIHLPLSVLNKNDLNSYLPMPLAVDIIASLSIVVVVH